MSLATTLLLALAPTIFAPKREPEKSKREVELEGECDALRDALERAWAERDSWRPRYDQSQEMLARIAGERIGRRLDQAMQQQLAAQQMAAYQPGLANAQQYQLQQAMNAQNYGLLGAQALAFHDCNCVPARHDMLFGGLGA